MDHKGLYLVRTFGDQQLTTENINGVIYRSWIGETSTDLRTHRIIRRYDDFEQASRGHEELAYALDKVYLAGVNARTEECLCLNCEKIPVCKTAKKLSSVCMEPIINSIFAANLKRLQKYKLNYLLGELLEILEKVK